jgi:hypothetical protein
MWRRFSPQNNFPFSGNAVRAQGERNCKKQKRQKMLIFENTRRSFLRKHYLTNYAILRNTAYQRKSSQEPILPLLILQQQFKS